MRIPSILLAIVSLLFLHAANGAVSWSKPPGGTTPTTPTVKAAEDKPPNPIYPAVQATSGETDLFGNTPSMFYKLTTTPLDGKFQIDSKTGVISHVPNPNFDYENPALPANPRRYVLTVTAFSGLKDPTYEEGKATINYELTNVNEAPVITNLPKCINIYENGRKEEVVNVDLTDPDGSIIKPAAGHPVTTTTYHKFYITDNDCAAPNNKFEINVRIPAGGVPPITQNYNELWVTGALDYETQNNCNMSIYADDQFGKNKVAQATGKPSLLKTNKHEVAVQVIDVNERPGFSVTKSTCEVYENTPIGTTVKTGIYPFRAYDKDKYPGPNCLGKWPDSVEYFVEGVFSELFTMHTVNVTEQKHQDGYLVVNKLIDREEPANPKDKKFTLYVNARDSRGMRNANGNEVAVECQILDVDDHPTICKDYKFEANLKENTPFDTKILTVECSDGDDVATHPITYKIKDVGIEADATTADRYFHFGKSGTSPIMTTKQRLDVEGGTLLKFKVLATQGAAFSQMSTTLTMEIQVVGTNDHPPTMDKDFYNFFVAFDEKDGFVIGKVSASDKDKPNSTMSYFLVEKAEGIMLGTRSGNVYVDYTNIEADSIIDDKTLKKNHKYWMSARAKDNREGQTSYYSDHVYIRVNTYEKKEVMIKIEVAVSIDDFTAAQVTDFEQSISNICKPCKGLCPEKTSKGSNTVITCFALKDDRTYQKTNKGEKAEYLPQSELIDYLTSEKLVAGDIYGFGAYDIVAVTPYDQGPDLLPLWICLGILLFIGLVCALAFGIKACISHGLCKKKPSEPMAPTPVKKLHPKSFDVDTFNFNYAEHNSGPLKFND